jgi:hypothetical protein
MSVQPARRALPIFDSTCDRNDERSAEASRQIDIDWASIEAIPEI